MEPLAFVNLLFVEVADQGDYRSIYGNILDARGDQGFECFDPGQGSVAQFLERPGFSFQWSAAPRSSLISISIPAH